MNHNEINKISNGCSHSCQFISGKVSEIQKQIEEVKRRRRKVQDDQDRLSREVVNNSKNQKYV